MKTDLEIEFFLNLGYFPHYEPKNALNYSKINRNEHKNAKKLDLMEGGASLFRKNIAESFQTNTKNIIPLSGGLDSRAILAVLLECTPAQNLHTYTFGTPGTYDYDIGCMIAKKLGTNHTAIPLDRFNWSEDEFTAAAKSFDHQTFLFHHAPPSVLEQFRDGITWSGYIGDAVTGGHLKKNPSQTREKAKQKYLQTRRESRSISLTNISETELLPMLGAQGDMMSHDEQILFAEVANITAPHVLMSGFQYQTPFINNDFFDFFMSIPDEFRLNQNLFKAMLIKEWPELFTLPSKNTYGLPLNASTQSQFIRRAKNKLWNVGRTYFKQIDWPALPMTNFFDIDKLLFNNSVFRDIVYKKLEQLKARNIVNWIDIDAIWNWQMTRKAYHGDAIKLLFSLEVNLQGLERKGEPR